MTVSLQRAARIPDRLLESPLAREGAGEGAAFTQFAIDGQCRMVRMHDVLDDGKAQPSATGLAG